MNKPFMNTRLGAVAGVLALLGGLSAAGPAAAEVDGMGLLKGSCAQCHDLTGPAPTTLAALWKRQGPDLFYAGNKYKRDWLESWLQKPTRIRPAGMFYADHVRAEAGHGDEIDSDKLPVHPALGKDEAKAVADALMTLKANEQLIHHGEYQPGTIPMSMGEMLFDKFRGCMACHEIEPGYGGLSGPEVYTAATRLQEDYMISYMRDPQAWDPRIFMPNKNLTDTDLQKLVHYMRGLAAEEAGK
jgi:mono/diheme cytochrome c family protein